MSSAAGDLLRQRFTTILEAVWKRPRPPSCATAAASDSSSAYSVDNVLDLCLTLRDFLHESRAAMQSLYPEFFPTDRGEFQGIASQAFPADAESAAAAAVDIAKWKEMKNCDGVWLEMDIGLAIVEDVIKTDCAMAKLGYENPASPAAAYVSYHPVRPQYALHHVMLNVLTLLVDRIHNVEIMAGLVQNFGMMCFDAFPARMHHHLLRLYVDHLIPRLSLLAVWDQRFMIQRQMQAAEMLGAAVAGDPAARTQTLLDRSPSSVQAHDMQLEYLNTGKPVTLPAVQYDTSVFPAILQTLALYAPQPGDHSDYASEVFYREKLLNLIIKNRPDAAVDMLEIVAYGTETMRKRAFGWLFHYWPRSMGHLSVADFADRDFGPSITSAITQALAADSPKTIRAEAALSTMERRTGDRLGVGLEHGHVLHPVIFPSLRDQVHRMEHSPANTGTSVAASAHLPPTSPTTPHPKPTTRSRRVSSAGARKFSMVKCAQCHQFIDGYGIRCFQCHSFALHLHCYRKPRRETVARKGVASSRAVALHSPAALYSTVGELAQHVEVTATSGSSAHQVHPKQHTFEVVNMFGVSICMVCMGPILGISVQGLRCSTCGMVVHHECLCKHGECVAGSYASCQFNAKSVHSPIITANVLESALLSHFASFYKCFSTRSADAMTLTEILLVLDVLHCQEQIIYYGFKAETVVLTPDAISVDSRAHLHSLLPNWANILTYFEQIVASASHSPDSKDPSLMSRDFIAMLSLSIKSGTTVDEEQNYFNYFERAGSTGNSAAATPPVIASKPADGQVNFITPNELLAMFPDDLDDTKMQHFYVGDLQQLLMGKFKLNYPETAAYLLQTMINYGFFELAEGSASPLLVPTSSTMAPLAIRDLSINVVLPHPTDDSVAAQLLLYILEASLIRSTDIAVNEAALVTLVNRYSPSLVETCKHFEICADELSTPAVLADLSIADLDQLMQRIMEILIKWLMTPCDDKHTTTRQHYITGSNTPTPTASQLQNVQVGEHVNNAATSPFTFDDIALELLPLSSPVLPHDKQSPGNLVDNQYPVLRRRLVEKYVNPWLRAYQLMNSELYDESIWQCLRTNCTIPDASSAMASSVHESIAVLKQSGISGLNLRVLTVKWLDMVWQSFSAQSLSDSSSVRQLNELDKQCIIKFFTVKENETELESPTMMRKAGKKKRQTRNMFWTAQKADAIELHPDSDSDHLRNRFKVGDSLKLVTAEFKRLHMGENASNSCGPDCAALTIIELLHASKILIPVTFFKEFVGVMFQESESHDGLSSPSSNFLAPLDHFNHFLRLLWLSILDEPAPFPGQAVFDILSQIVHANTDRLSSFFVSVVDLKHLSNQFDIDPYNSYSLFLRWIWLLTLYIGGCSFETIYSLKLVADLDNIQTDDFSKTCPMPILHNSETVNYNTIMLRLLTLNGDKVARLAASHGGRAYIHDIRIDMFKFLYGLLIQSTSLADESMHLNYVSSFVLENAWDLIGSIHDAVAQVTMPLLLKLVAFEFRKFNTMQAGSGSAYEYFLKSTFHRCVYDSFHGDSWEVRLRAVDCGFGFFSKLSQKQFVSFKAEMWLFGPIVSYLASALSDAKDEVRSVAISLYRSLDGARLKTMLNIWALYVNKVDNADMLHWTLQRMTMLNASFPSLPVLPFKDLIRLYSHVEMSTAVDPGCIVDQQNTNCLVITLALQQIGNHAEVCVKELQQITSIIARELGVVAEGSVDGLATEFDPCHPQHRAIFTCCVALLSRIFDRYHINWEHKDLASPVKESTQQELHPEPAETFATFMARIKAFTENLASSAAGNKKSADRATEADIVRADSEKKVEQLAHKIVEVLASAVASPKIFAKLDASLTKAWLELMLIYVYKFSVDKMPASETVENIMHLLLESLYYDTVCDESKLTIITICTVLLKRSASITTHLLSKEIVAMTKLITSYRRHRNHPLLLRTKFFLRAAFEQFSDSGLFVLLFCTETSHTNDSAAAVKQHFSSDKTTTRSSIPAGKRKSQTPSSLDSDLFFVLFTVLGVQSSVRKQNQTVSVELQFADAPVKDVISRLLSFRELDSKGFVRVLRNLIAYIDLIKPPLDSDVIYDFTRFLEKLTTHAFPWRKRVWDASAIVDLCTTLAHRYPSHIKVLFSPIKNVFLFACRRCVVNEQAIEQLAAQLSRVLRKTEKFSEFSKAALTELKSMLRQNVRASGSILSLLLVLEANVRQAQGGGNSNANTIRNIGLFSNLVLDIADDLTSYALYFYRERAFADRNFPILQVVARLLVECWSARSEIQKSFLADSSDWRRSLYVANLVTFGLIYSPASNALNLILDHFPTMTQVVVAALDSKGIQESARNTAVSFGLDATVPAEPEVFDINVTLSSAGRVLSELPFSHTSTMRRNNQNLNVSPSQTSSSATHEGIYRAILQLKLLAMVEMQINDVHRFDEHSGRIRRARVTGTSGRIWTLSRNFFDSVWPCLKRKLGGLPTDEGVNDQVRVYIWEIFLDLLLFCCEVGSELGQSYRVELSQLLDLHVFELQKHPKIATSIQRFLNYLDDPPMIITVEQALQQCIESWRCSFQA